MSEKEEKTNEVKHGIPMSEEDLEQYFQDFQDIEESINLVNKEGEDL